MGEGVLTMGFYGWQRDLVYMDERYICRCMKCGQERLKRACECILHREGSGTAKVLGYFCPSCYAEFLDEYETHD